MMEVCPRCRLQVCYERRQPLTAAWKKLKQGDTGTDSLLPPVSAVWPRLTILLDNTNVRGIDAIDAITCIFLSQPEAVPRGL
jgi:hypothetical protein